MLPSVLIHGSASVAAPDGNTSSFEGSEASVLKLRTVTITLTAQIAYYLGELAVAAELSRCAIKLRVEEHEQDASKVKIIETDDVTMWVIRGGAFALMGNFYLARVHFREAKSLLAEFPGIDKLLWYVEELEERSYTNFLPLSEEVEEVSLSSATISWQQRLLNDVKLISRLLFQQDQYYRKMQMSTLCERKRGVKSNLSVDVEFLRGLIDENSIHDTNTMMENLHKNVKYEKVQWFEIIKRVFYEGQILFLEQMYHSADVKFTISLAMIIMHRKRTMGASLPIAEIIESYDATDKYLNGMKTACLTNIAKCRFHRDQTKSLKTHFTESDLSCDTYEAIVKFIIQNNAIDLCDYALLDATLLWHDKVSVLLTKVDLFQSMKKYEDCLNVLKTIPTVQVNKYADDIMKDDNSFLIVRGYEDDTLYTQDFICGMYLATPKRHDNPDIVHSNIENSFQDKLTRMIENRKNRIEYLQRTKR